MNYLIITIKQFMKDVQRFIFIQLHTNVLEKKEIIE